MVRVKGSVYQPGQQPLHLRCSSQLKPCLCCWTPARAAGAEELQESCSAQGMGSIKSYFPSLITLQD